MHPRPLFGRSVCASTLLDFISMNERDYQGKSSPASMGANVFAQADMSIRALLAACSLPGRTGQILVVGSKFVPKWLMG
jgi:hypothetical protein